ncbi:hypothetical protein [Thiocapsa sp. UBA6158]|uniref:hypothetical protein n=1 Tax=Thiocapsa sp. UBA6158 TaxID=1947692 RepID=UPI0025F5C1ED|nr:hypothetical protein [Thiocapsa sp. UBA6158]
MSDFSLVHGRVGKLAVDYWVTVADEGVAELTSKVFGHSNDEIRIRENVSLDGARARGLVKTRVAVEDEASAARKLVPNSAQRGTWRGAPGGALNLDGTSEAGTGFRIRVLDELVVDDEDTWLAQTLVSSLESRPPPNHAYNGTRLDSQRQRRHAA